MDNFQLPTVPPHVLQPEVRQEDINAVEIVQIWLRGLSNVLSSKAFTGNLDHLFTKDCWWRDFVALNWNFSTKRGQDSIANYLATATNPISELQHVASGPLKPTLLDMHGMIWLQSAFTFKTPHGSGTGFFRLLNVSDHNWKAWTIFTQLEQLDLEKALKAKQLASHANIIADQRNSATTGRDHLTDGQVSEGRVTEKIVPAEQESSTNEENIITQATIADNDLTNSDHIASSVSAEDNNCPTSLPSNDNATAVNEDHKTNSHTPLVGEQSTNASDALNGASTTRNTMSTSEDELQVLIVGAGQAGLSLGARLKGMGVKTLLVERHARLGDVWRERYQSVSLNTPAYCDHPPFMKVPSNWPRWLSGADVAKFYEHYGQMMGLDVLTGAEVVNAEYIEAERRYRVSFKRGDWTTTLYPRHVVLATGTYSDEPVIPNIPGHSDFGGLLYHSSKHMTASNVPDLGQKRVVVIGTGPSGHDIAQDYADHGAKSVHLVQRHPIFFMSPEACEAVQFGLWNLDDISTEQADLIANAIPLAVIRTMSLDMTANMAEIDKDLIKGLREAGMAIKTGEDGIGVADYQLIYGGKYYCDQGAARMIVNGQIKVHYCEKGMSEIRPSGLTLGDGTAIDADIIVFATGYHNSVQHVEKLLGRDVSKKMSPHFGILDEENERGGVSAFQYSLYTIPLLIYLRLTVVAPNRTARVVVHDG